MSQIAVQSEDEGYRQWGREERRDGQYCENIHRHSLQSSFLSHLASPHLVDIEPAGGPAAAPGVVVVGPQVVAGQRGVEHDRQ